MNETIPKISVIVPVYKAENYLHRCVDSLLAQTFQDFEILLIDDGSPDRSGEICDECARKDKRVRVFHKENGGVTSARSLGVNKCECKYVCFVDADDDIPVYALETLANATSERYDIIVGRADDGRYLKEELTAEEFRSHAITGTCFPPAPWGKLVKKTLFNAQTFDIPREIVKGEDMLMNIRLAFANTKQVRLVSENIYHYRVNPESCIHTFQNSLDYEILYSKWRELSIPVEERSGYQRECILSKLNGLSLIANQLHKNIWNNTSYYKSLIQDVESNHLHIPLLTRVKFSTRSGIIMLVAIYGERIFQKVKNIIYGKKSIT